jgi:hypothetical protein
MDMGQNIEHWVNGPNINEKEINHKLKMRQTNVTNVINIPCH